jgi:hypothetical protein
MKVQVKKVGVVPEPFPPISMNLSSEELRYSSTDYNSMYIVKLEYATSFSCPEELFGEIMETTIIPKLKSYIFKELEDIVQELRIYIYEGNRKEALDSLNKLMRLVYEGPEIEYI